MGCVSRLALTQCSFSVRSRRSTSCVAFHGLTSRSGVVSLRPDSKKAKLFITLRRSADFFENMKKFNEIREENEKAANKIQEESKEPKTN